MESINRATFTNFSDCLMMTLINLIFNVSMNKKLNLPISNKKVLDLAIIQVKFIFKIIKPNLRDSVILTILKKERIAHNQTKVKGATFTKE